MFAIEFSINIVVLGLMILVAALVGFAVRFGQIMKCRTKIEELEREILNNYAEILALEKENSSMESILQDIQSPVIPIKTALKDEQEDAQHVSDMSLRKKLLSRENLLQQNVASK
jgi:wobble nucleotide-excising tRNase